ncbi:hypothetical protein ACWGH2_42405 [Streptomyces sp. NPDC054871]
MPQSQRMIAICHTDPNVCAVSGKPSVGTYYAAPEPPTYRGACMECGQPITDLVPVTAAG